MPGQVLVARQGPEGLCPGSDAELGEHFAQVILHCPNADEQPLSDLRIGKSVPGQPGDLILSAGQCGAMALGRNGLCQHGGVAEGKVPDISPQQASRSGAAYVRDEDLPMLAAAWLTQGFDSNELRELAGLTRQEARQGGRRLLTGVLSSLGWPMRDWRNAPEGMIPWLGRWHLIAWAQEQMDRMLSPYAAAQRIIEVAGDVPGLWAPAGAERLVSLLRDWDEHPAERQRIDDQLREHLRSLQWDDVPPTSD